MELKPNPKFTPYVTGLPSTTRGLLKDAWVLNLSVTDTTLAFGKRLTLLDSVGAVAFSHAAVTPAAMPMSMSLIIVRPPRAIL